MYAVKKPAVDAENLICGARDVLAQLRKTHLWESSLNPTTSRFAVDGHAHVEGLDHGARRIDWTSWPALVPLALEAYDGPRPIGLADCDERRWSVSTGNPLLDQLARGLGSFRSWANGSELTTSPAYAIKYLVCDSGLSDEELGAFLAAGGAEPYNGSDYLEAFHNLSPASRSSAPNARCTAAPPPGSRQSRTACASRAPSGRHRTPSSTCSASSGSSARMSA